MSASGGRIVLARVGLGLATTLLLLVLLEGLASLTHFASRLIGGEGKGLQGHIQYDAEIGWVNEPNTVLPDFYGAGRHVHINAQGYRGRSETPMAVPSGRARVVCSGDSFTAGFGVSDEHAWCARLVQLEPALESVNLGIGGYGIDQAYLRYMRESEQLAHQVHLFAFIHEDLFRMESDHFMGYPKPRLTLRRNEFAVTNVPVPRAAYLTTLARARTRAFQELRLVSGLRSLLQPQVREQTPTAVRPLVDLALAVFARLEQRSRETNSTLMLVYLPSPGDDAPHPMDGWREVLGRAARQQGTLFVDLIEPFREESAATIDSFFLREGDAEGPGAAGHYNEAGNSWVAEQLLGSILAEPAINRMVKARTTP